MSPYLEKGIFKKLKIYARVSFDTVEWEHKADIDPKTLHEDSVPYNIN
jgi:hypothetical protein